MIKDQNLMLLEHKTESITRPRVTTQLQQANWHHLHYPSCMHRYHNILTCSCPLLSILTYFDSCALLDGFKMNNE